MKYLSMTYEVFLFKVNTELTVVIRRYIPFELDVISFDTPRQRWTYLNDTMVFFAYNIAKQDWIN